MDSKPAPPPEAVLIRVARDAAGLTITEAARRVAAANPDTGVSTARWSQIEQGYEVRGGQVREVHAKPGMLARMAAILSLTPQRLTEEGERPDAAEILSEIERREEGEARIAADVPAEDTAGDGTSAGDLAAAHAIRVLMASAVEAVRQHIDSVMAVNPRARGHDIFPDSKDEAELWDLDQLPPEWRREMIATLQRLRMEEEAVDSAHPLRPSRPRRSG